jgi:hypothetical protein
MTLLANGCSHTAGTEIDPNHIPKCVEEAWPRWVADHYNIPYINIAQGGAGNEEISRSTIHKVSTLIERDNTNPSELIVVICWSGFDRYEFWDTDRNVHRSISIGYRNPSFIAKKYAEIRSLMEPENWSNYKNLYYVYITSKFLESYGIKYYFSNAIRSFTYPAIFEAHPNLKEDYIDMLSMYGTRIDNHMGFFDNKQIFNALLEHLPRSGLGGNFHWGRDGQQLYAKHFIKHMEEVDARRMGS